MKLSTFNIEKEIPDGIIVYNTFSSGVLFLNNEYKNEYLNLKKGKKCNKKDLEKELTKGSMLVSDEVDEVSQLKVLNNATRFNTQGISFTIAPTMKCNFACPYCFEEGVRYNTMTQTIENETIEFIKNFYIQNTPFGICWYGGEPLLGIKNIERITNKLFENESLKESYQADIITNGFYLSRKNAELLASLGVKTAQITLDGPPDIHDTRRVPRNGKKTFNTILENIKNSYDLLEIVIRVNVDRTNISRVHEILDILEEEGLRNKLGFYIAAVDDSASQKPNPQCFSDKEFSEEEFNFYIEALKRGFNLINIPGQNLGMCGAISLNNYVIDPLGDLYKCWNEIGRKEKAVGNVVEGPLYNNVMVEYLNYEAITDKKCMECKVLPACMGGCPYITINSERKCNSIRYNAEKLIELVYSNQMVDG